MSQPPAAVAGGTKSPKTPRRVKTPDPRQVHFEQESRATGKPAIITVDSPRSATCTQADSDGDHSHSNNKTEPSVTIFPQVGLAPNSALQWHTSANPSLSVCTAGLPAGGTLQQPLPPHYPGFFAPPPQHNTFPPTLLNTTCTIPQPSSITYIGHPGSFNGQVPAMGDYQNCAPPPTGTNFQPPVPDTTFGPIPHVYVPRFDGGFVPGAQQPAVGGFAPQSCPPGPYVVAQQPYIMQQPVAGQQPYIINSQPAFIPQQQPMTGYPAAFPAVGMAGGPPMNGGIPIAPGNSGHIPEVTGLGRTAGEETLRQVKFAHANRLYEPQDFKPADDDPSRFYYVREVDGNWTQRNRFTIDHMGDCRWYVTDEGWFYAVRLPD